MAKPTGFTGRQATDPCGASGLIQRTAALIVLVTFGVLVAPLGVGAQQPATPRVGFLLMGSSQAGLTPLFDAFRAGLRELGWVENENIAIEYRFAGESPDRLPELAADLIRLKVDVIIGSTAGVQAAQRVTSVSAGRVLRRQDPERDEGGRPSGGTANQIRPRCQHQDGQGTRADHPRVIAAAGGRGHTVASCGGISGDHDGELRSARDRLALLAPAGDRAGSLGRPMAIGTLTE